MSQLSSLEQRLCVELRDHPRKHAYDYDQEAEQALLRLLFDSLCNHNPKILQDLFKGQQPGEGIGWSLSRAQGAEEGAEYSEAARGKLCGHILKSGEPSYRCKTCTSDNTCVLCSRCFEASDHDGHQVLVTVSTGNASCCDCGDAEAWRIPVHCSIHSAYPESTEDGKAKEAAQLPPEIVESIRTTISRSLEYFLDVTSCSPEQLKLPKTVETIQEDELRSRLLWPYYPSDAPERPAKDFCLVLWNDEKHNPYDAQDVVAKAVRTKRSHALDLATACDQVGRVIVKSSSDVEGLLESAKIIEKTKFATTIRSARDTFREQMGATIIQWFSDIAGCAFGPDTHILRNTICEEMLKPWKKGSGAYREEIGQEAIFDYEDYLWNSSKQEGSQWSWPAWTALHLRGTTAQQILQLQIERDLAAAEDGNTSDGADNDGGNVDEEAPDSMDIDESVRDNETQDQDMDDALEASEATLAGYPPPPLPPTPRPESLGLNRNSPLLRLGEEPPVKIPLATKIYGKVGLVSQPLNHWTDIPKGYAPRKDLPPHLDLWRRVRIDWMILYDLRLWNHVRCVMRDLFIGTVVNVTEFKKVLGLRFSGLYAPLAQLYLVADREPDCSIISLSLQMLTTPSITAEVIERGNFMSTLMAIIYTFITTRQVGYPGDINLNATLAFEAGVAANRRLDHFFLDLRYLFDSPHALECVRVDDRYLLQFLDLAKLHQGIVPNIRALGEHVEYEPDAWINAWNLSKHINRLCRDVANAFSTSNNVLDDETCRAIRHTARAAIVNSLGAERQRFPNSELKDDVQFKTILQYDFEDKMPDAVYKGHHIVKFVVEKGEMSFHHPLHHMLSWLIEKARNMDAVQLRGLLTFSTQELTNTYPPLKSKMPDYTSQEHLMALFDIPLRVCAWLAQIKSKMWVRNGVTLSHQMSQYKNVSNRDVGYQRDLFLLQVALVTCNTSDFLASMIARYGLSNWVQGLTDVVEPTIDETQMADLADEFVNLLIMLICDRSALLVPEEGLDLKLAGIRREIAQVLYFRPLSHSTLWSSITEKYRDDDEFETILRSMTTFRAPEGINDTGMFELRKEFVGLVDPYIAPYSRNQRDEAEAIYCEDLAKRTGRPLKEVVFEPHLQPIRSGLFKNLSEFTGTALFAQLVYALLKYLLNVNIIGKHNDAPPDAKGLMLTQIERILQSLLHLTMVAIAEDGKEPGDAASFVQNMINLESGDRTHPTIISVLAVFRERKEFESFHAKIHTIFRRIHERRPQELASSAARLGIRPDLLDAESQEPSLEDEERKKRESKARAARALAKMQERQKAFAQAQPIDWGNSDLSESEEIDHQTADDNRRIWPFPSGPCNYCQEECNEDRLYGTLSFVTESTILRKTPQGDTDWVDEIFQVPVDLDRQFARHRPFGVAGKNHVDKIQSDGRRVDFQGLGKGFPPHNAWVGSMGTGCGHLMHYSCFENYIAATDARHRHQNARHQPESRKDRQFCCPYCKALGNVFTPIVWKPKVFRENPVLDHSTVFDTWLVTEVKSSENHEELGHLPRTVAATLEGFTAHEQFAFIDKLTSSDTANAVDQAMQQSLSEFHSLPETLLPDIMQHESNTIAESRGRMTEVLQVWTSMRESFRLGNPTPTTSLAGSPSSLDSFMELLVNTLGTSVSAVEIAQRGMEAQHTLIEGVPDQMLTYLYILSETITSHIVLRITRHNALGPSSSMDMQNQTKTYRQLFQGGYDVDGPLEMNGKPVQFRESSLLQDPFLLLTQASVFLVHPGDHTTMRHYIRLTYMLEILRVVISYGWNKADHAINISIFDKVSVDDQELMSKWICNREQEHAFARFVNMIGQMQGMYGDPAGTLKTDLYEQLDNPRGRSFCIRLRAAIAAYALPFLRKALILMHVRFGVDFAAPLTGSARGTAPELSRLSALLGVPSLNEVIAWFTSSHTAASAMHSLLNRWVQSYFLQGKQGGSALLHHGPELPLAHPGIFELVGLPSKYASLADAAIALRCPSSGAELKDPCVCLWCGEIFCGQAGCCSRSLDRLLRRGGAQRHKEKCGKNIGVYISIRKCILLFLHGDNGSYLPAPYLDEYGEPDQALRRSNQLYLNQKRLDDFVRKAWLHHTIPSEIARKLEGDHNTGGWDTV